MSSKQKTLLINRNPFGFVNANNLVLKKNIERMVLSSKTKKLHLSGGYNNLQLAKVDSLLNSKKENKNVEKFDTSISEKNIEYLEKIIRYCNYKNIKLILIKSPIHPQYDVRQNKNMYKHILSNNLKGVEYLDFSNFPLDNAYYADLQHLNHKGAKVFSIWFNKLFDNGLLDSTNMQQFIDKEISMLN